MGALGWLAARFGRARTEAPTSGSLPGAKPALPGSLPRHVAIIMDGNGRWAARRGLPVLRGHRAGTEAVRRVIKAARELGIGQLTLFAFSTENWSRPREEVEGLMQLLEEMIKSEMPDLRDQGLRVVFIGQREGLSATLQELMRESEASTAANDVMTLYLAINYGGRLEILDAVRRAVAAGEDLQELTERDLVRYLYAPDMEEPDLVIRTSGEQRLSNFLLWESAYSELYFSDKLWPDFDRDELERALRDYASRDRRFGARRAGRLA